MKTRSEAYFLQLFAAATLHGAAEAAANSERSAGGEKSVPVDVYKLAMRRGFKVVEDLGGPSCEEGQLLPVADGFRVRLRSAVTDARKRFSLAHEIGHSYFYKDEGVGIRHVIGVLNAAERRAEERICNLFASALLMPPKPIRQELDDHKASSPSSLISALQLVASKFRVSMPALLMRIASLELERPTCLLIWSRFGLSPRKRVNPKLRVEYSLGLGDWSNRRFWVGTPIEDLGIGSALRLYQLWKDKSSGDRGGQFAISRAGDLDHDAIPCEMHEPGITMSTRIMGLWKHETVQCTSSSALYSWKHGDDEVREYVVTAVAPIPD